MLTVRPRTARPLPLPRFDSLGAALATTRDRFAATRGQRPPLWILLPALLVAAVELLPLVYLVARTFEAGESAWQMLVRPRTAEVVLNTVLLAGTVALSTIAIAVPLAWLTSRTDLPGRRYWSTDF